MLMEALQMLKFSLKKQHLNFTLAWEVKQKDLSANNPDNDILSDLLRSRGDSSCEDIQDAILHYMEKIEEWSG
jgi:hypothetical protein